MWTPLVASAEFTEQGPALSPDGRWLAYTSDETGQQEVYVRPFPDVDSDRVRVSTDGGSRPMWAHSGRELFFVNADRGFVVAEVEADSEFRVLQRETLFILGPEYLISGLTGFYEVAPGDQQFLMGHSYAVPLTTGLIAPDFILVQNWFEELRQRMGN